MKRMTIKLMLMLLVILFALCGCGRAGPPQTSLPQMNNTDENHQTNHENLPTGSTSDVGSGEVGESDTDADVGNVVVPNSGNGLAGVGAAPESNDGSDAGDAPSAGTQQGNGENTSGENDAPSDGKSEAGNGDTANNLPESDAPAGADKGKDPGTDSSVGNAGNSGNTGTASKPENKACAVCGKTGHSENACPSKKTEVTVSCSYCKKNGHEVASCPKKAADEAPCAYCGIKGHKADACAKKAADEAPCTYCQQTGHKVDVCPKKAADEAPCAYCNQAGHKEADCEKKKADAFDINYWVQYAKDYAESIGLTLDPTMTKDANCWDTPIAAYYKCIYLERDIQSRMGYYKKCIEYYGFEGYVWAWAEEVKPGVYDLYVFYA